MTVIDDWFKVQGARERRVVHLEDMLLGNRFVAYFAYRLRFFFAKYAFASGLALIKVLVLHQVLGVRGFLNMIVVIAVVSLISAAWWGALEVLRTRVRRLYRTESRRVVSREIANWVTFGIAVAAIVAVTTLVVLTVMALASAGGIGPVAAAAAAMIVRGAFDLPIRAYHAGVYAVRRVYRPLTSMLFLEAMSLVALLALVPVFGPYAVAAAELLLALTYAAVSLRYTSRMHRTVGLEAGTMVRSRIASALPRRSPRNRIRQAARRATLHPAHLRASVATRRPRTTRVRLQRAWAMAREVLPPAVAGVSMGLDAFVIFAIVAAGVFLPAEPTIAVLVAAIGPTIRAGFDWSQLTYFDLKRLDAPLFANLRRRLDRASIVLAVVLGLAFSLVAVAIGLAFFSAEGWWLLAIIPFVMGASLLGLVQMEAFAAGAYRRVVLGGALLGGSLALLPWLASVGIHPFLVLAVVPFTTAILVRVLSGLLVAAPRESDPLLATAWVARLGAVAHPVVLGVVRIRPRSGGPLQRGVPYADLDASTWHANRLARRLAARVGAAGGVTTIYPDTVVWFERPGRSRLRIDRRRILVESAGKVRGLREQVAADGHAALDVVDTWGLFREASQRDLAAVAVPEPATTSADPAEPADAALVAQPRPGPGPLWKGPTADELTARFRGLFPEGIVFEPQATAPPALGLLESADRRQILRDAVRWARDLAPARGHGRFDVTAWCPDGSVRLVFVAERTVAGRVRAAWRQYLRDANLSSASSGRLTPRPMLGASTRGRVPAALVAQAATHHGRGSD